jgi:5-bromo-4-chloroindolyl phosphate hydrolysis protein
MDIRKHMLRVARENEEFEVQALKHIGAALINCKHMIDHDFTDEDIRVIREHLDTAHECVIELLKDRL